MNERTNQSGDQHKGFPNHNTSGRTGLGVYTVSQLVRRYAWAVLGVIGGVISVGGKILDLVSGTLSVFLVVLCAVSVFAFYWGELKQHWQAVHYDGRLLLVTIGRVLVNAIRHRPRPPPVRLRGSRYWLGLFIALCAINAALVDTMKQEVEAGELPQLPVKYSTRTLKDFEFYWNEVNPRVFENPWPLSQPKKRQDRKAAKTQLAARQPSVRPAPRMPLDIPTSIIGEPDGSVPPVLSTLLMPPCLLLGIVTAFSNEEMSQCLGQKKSSLGR